MFCWKDLPRLQRAVHAKQAARFACSHPSSTKVRQQFLDFFVDEHAHVPVPSSPVVPYGDPTLAFVNAGMNQFKPIFLGQVPGPYKRAANSQKCIRVGGKHNDLDDVGRDGYHHTFFEMLGSWSFNDYFKSEACSMAWDLLTKVYKIPPDQLFITYFGGNAALGLPADDECREIWRGLGVAPDHILPFGMKDNFWEMGLVGPCGPCSEIHVNKGNQSRESARQLVNQGSEDVVEIWNLVFMQYNRISNDVLDKLPAHHIDTGMGLERLVAFLQSKRSNYDTDLFLPLIDSVHKIAGGTRYQGNYQVGTPEGQRDCAYRLLADHSRMITVALADGAFPDSNHRLRRVIRQAIVTSRKWFNQDASLLLELSRRVVDSLGRVYPELSRNLPNVDVLLRFEEEVFREQLAKSGKEWTSLITCMPELASLPSDQQPGLVAGLRQLEEWALTRRCQSESVPGQLAFKLYSTYGLQEESLLLLSRCKGWTINWPDFHHSLAQARLSTLKDTAAQAEKPQFQLTGGVTLLPTDWNCYDAYSISDDGSCTFPPVDATLLALVTPDGALAGEASVGQRVAIVTDKSCFYYEAGGQVSDTGTIVSSTGRALVEEVRRLGDHIQHIAVVQEGHLLAGQSVQLLLDAEQRLQTMSNHTATHLLQAAIKSVLRVTCQKSSLVTPDYLKFDFGLFQSDIGVEVVSQIEALVKKWIAQRLSVDRLLLPLREALAMDAITLVPGENYPDTVSVIRVPSVTIEPCCGTHVRNTSDIGDFAIVSLKSAGIGSRSVRAVTRSAAAKAQADADQLSLRLIKLEESVTRDGNSWGIRQLRDIDENLKSIRSSLDSGSLPVVKTKELRDRLDKLESLVRLAAQQLLAKTMQEQMEAAMNEASAFVIVALSISPDLLEIGRAKLSLIKATRHCQRKPALVFAIDDGHLIGRCTVPQETVTEKFDAEKWCASILRTIGGKGGPPKGQDHRFCFNVRSRKVTGDYGAFQQEALSLATRYAQDHM